MSGVFGRYKVGMQHPIDPVLIQRANDLGWLAATPDSYPLRFAVEAPTEEEARAKFAIRLAHWERMGAVSNRRREGSLAQ